MGDLKQFKSLRFFGHFFVTMGFDCIIFKIVTVVDFLGNFRKLSTKNSTKLEKFKS